MDPKVQAKIAELQKLIANGKFDEAKKVQQELHELMN